MHTLSFVYALNTYYVYYPNRRILKSLGLFENLAFVIMSTRENIRLIARASSITKGATQYTLYFRREYSMDRSSIFGRRFATPCLRHIERTQNAQFHAPTKGFNKGILAVSRQYPTPILNRSTLIDTNISMR